MDKNLFTNTLWSLLVIDNQMDIVEVINFDKRLFFGKSPITSCSLSEAAGSENRQQIQIVEEGIKRARKEKRPVSLVYHSIYSESESTHVSVHAEYHLDGSVCLYMTALNSDDMFIAQRNIESNFSTMLLPIYENLPIAIEIYDHNGKLIEINEKGVQVLGAKSKEELIGISLFDNPLLNEEIKERLRIGDSVHFRSEYGFNLINNALDVPKADIRNLDISVSTVTNQRGEIDRFIAIIQDITEYTLLKQKYENLYTQSTAILNSLPIGIGVYNREGTMLYANDTNCRIFGIDLQKAREYSININNSPRVSQEIKDAIRSGEAIQINFPYDFLEAQQKGHIETTHTTSRLIECNGQPILNAQGELDSYMFIMTDITEKFQNEETLRQNRLKTEMALQSADIMFWEFDVASQLFYSDNEPMNGCDQFKPLTIKQYIDTILPDHKYIAQEIIEKMIVGEDFTFNFDAPILFPNNTEWHYCAINGSPYEKNSENGRVVKYVGTRKNNTLLNKRKQLQDKILNAIPMSIHIKDVNNDFRYVFCNEESKRLFGTSEDTTTYDVMDEEAVERIRKTDLEVFNTGVSYLGLERVTLKDGRWYDTIVQKSIIDDDGKRLLLSIRWDQSLQNDLKRQSQLFSLTLKAMNAFTWFYEPDKERIHFGDGFDKVGRKASEINTLDTFITCVHPDDASLFTDSLNNVLANNSDGVWKIAFRVDFNGNGVYTWWEGHGILETTIVNDVPYRYMFGMTICIEPHKQAELTLLKTQEDLNNLIRQNELILNNTNSGLAYITTDFVVLWENVSICPIQLPQGAYKRGEYCYKSTHNRTAPCENCVMQQAIASQKAEHIQFSVANNRIIEIFAVPVFNEDDSIDGVVIRIDDVTERQEIIKELKQAKILAEQSDKLKSAFLANMSHEIRTPLNAIIGFSELLMHSTEEDEKEEYRNIITTNNELLLNIISDILDLSKIESGSVKFTYEEFDLAEYFNSMAISMRQRISNPNVQLISVSPYERCTVSLDRNRVAQLVTNYVTNAIKYTPKGSIEMGYKCVEGGVQLYVKDSGIGIPVEKQNRVFQRFAKLDDFAQGTGLGLSICKAIAEAMGGNVGFESTNGNGSTFWAFLPCKVNIKTTE